MLQSRFYKDKICLNVLANTIENAKEIYKETEGHVLIGLLSTNYSSVDMAIKDIHRYAQAVNGAVSIGLGGGNPNQWKTVADICRHYEAEHINQVFPAVGFTRACVNNNMSFINCLVYPANVVGYVTISSGPLSSKGPVANIPIKSAIALIRDMGGNSMKLFPLNGLKMRKQYQKIAEVCGQEGFPLEPTGGINVTNFEEIITIALEAGVPKVIPHIYSSIIDPSTGNTRIDAIKNLYQIMKKVG